MWIQSGRECGKMKTVNWLCKVDGDFLFLISITATTLLLVSF